MRSLLIMYSGGECEMRITIIIPFPLIRRSDNALYYHDEKDYKKPYLITK